MREKNPERYQQINVEPRREIQTACIREET